MTIFEALGQVLGAIVAFATAPVTMIALGAVLAWTGFAMMLVSFGGYAEGEPVAATGVLIGGIMVIILGIAMCIWAGSSANPFAWIAR